MKAHKQRGFIGGGIIAHTHASAASGGNTLQHIPAGTMIDFCGTVLPTGFLACDGAAVSRTTYAALFAAIGETWGVGDGSTTFNVPDFRRRSVVGNGGVGTGQLGNAVGNVGGAETITLTTAQIPSHAHNQQTERQAGGIMGPWLMGGTSSGGGFANLGSANNADGANVTTENTGSGSSHNNYPPAAIVQKIIKT